jgi:hypothetical protein
MSNWYKEQLNELMPFLAPFSISEKKRPEKGTMRKKKN